jgi:hypothetical protein
MSAMSERSAFTPFIYILCGQILTRGLNSFDYASASHCVLVVNVTAPIQNMANHPILYKNHENDIFFAAS